jgi:hypothetical protein
VTLADNLIEAAGPQPFGKRGLLSQSLRERGCEEVSGSHRRRR